MELQTERLQRETGAETVQNEVHVHSRPKQLRLVTITATKNGRKQAQAVALTRLAVGRWSPAVLAVDRELEHHRLMGRTFKEAGVAVRQNRLLRLRAPLLSRKIATLYGCNRWRSAEIECYEFWAGDVLYGIVVEVKNPYRRQAPARPREGLSSVRQKLKRTPRLIGWTVAGISGVAVGLYLYLRCLYYVRVYQK